MCVKEKDANANSISNESDDDDSEQDDMLEDSVVWIRRVADEAEQTMKKMNISDWVQEQKGRGSSDGLAM